MAETRPRTHRPRRIARLVTSGIVVALAGGYLAADAYDVLPGFLTTKPAVEVQALPQPVPTSDATPAVTELDADAPVPQGLATVLDAILDGEEIDGEVGAQVRDALTGEVLYDRDSSGQRTPASVTKVITAAAALGALGETSTFRTTTAFDAGSGDLYLVGGGDVLLSAGKSRPDAINGHAGLATLAEQTAARLKESGTQDVILHADVSRYTGTSFNPGWDAKDISNGYITNITPLMVDSGYESDKDYSPRIEHPDQSAAETFAEALEEQGITVTVDGTQKAPAEASELASVESAPLGSIIRFMLFDSDNVVAEVLGREVAIARGVEATYSSGAEETIAQLGDMGINTGSISLQDTSGLNYENQISPADLTGIVETAAQTPELTLLISNMPVSGLSGTLTDRYRDDSSKSAAGLVQAKTGTLNTVTSLSGAVKTADGRVLVFSVMADHLKEGSVLDARKIIDTAIAELADCGCSS